MFPPRFDYRRADTVDEALDLLAAGGDAVPVAGGHGLVPDLKAGAAAPGTLVDVSGLDALDGVEVDEEADNRDGDAVRVGALATHADLAASEPLADAAPALAEAAAAVGDRQIRNRGTAGGNVAEADPAADLPAAVVAADATVAVRGPDGTRTVPADDFFRGGGETALSADELVTELRLPAHDRGGYEKRTHPATGYATVGVAVVADVADGAVTDPRVAAAGVADRAVRLPSVEDDLAGAPVDDVDPAVDGGDDIDLSTVADGAGDDLDAERLVGDAHASADFRVRVLPTFVERAVERVLGRPGTGGGGR